MGFHLQFLFLYLNNSRKSRGKAKTRRGTKWEDTQGLRTVDGGTKELAKDH